jgi:cell wall-associated NlpC family hydrolase
VVIAGNTEAGSPLCKKQRSAAQRLTNRIGFGHDLFMLIDVAKYCAVLLIAAGQCSADEPDVPAELAAAQSPAVFTSSDLAQELVFHALAFVDVKYKYGGTSPDTGWDCSGYVSHVFKEALGVALPHNAVSMSNEGTAVSRGELQPGDLVFFNTLKRSFSHVGIYLGDSRFIHAPASGKAVQISNMASDYWARRFNGGRRIVVPRR